MHEFRIIVEQEEEKSENDFPNDFSISFERFGKNFNTKFTKHVKKNDESTGRIYVIDEITGKPKEYKVKSDDVVSIILSLL